MRINSNVPDLGGLGLLGPVQSDPSKARIMASPIIPHPKTVVPTNAITTDRISPRPSFNFKEALSLSFLFPFYPPLHQPHKYHTRPHISLRKTQHRKRTKKRKKQRLLSYDLLLFFFSLQIPNQTLARVFSASYKKKKSVNRWGSNR